MGNSQERWFAAAVAHESYPKVASGGTIGVGEINGAEEGTRSG